MSLMSLKQVLEPALQNGTALAGLVVLGYEDAQNFVAAAETENLAIILQAGPGFRRHMPLEIIGPMFRKLAENARVPIVTHLDHATSKEECAKALDLGFSSVMYDGSRLEIAQNIDETAFVAEMAHRVGASCENKRADLPVKRALMRWQSQLAMFICKQANRPKLILPL
jgi:fructose-bisphosphate aldolase class II